VQFLFPQDPNIMFYAVLAFAGLSVLGIGMAVLLFVRGDSAESVSDRMHRISTGERGAHSKIDEQVGKTLSSLSRLTAPKEQKEITTLKKTLSYAGFRSPSAPVYFFGFKTLGAIILGGASVLYSWSNSYGMLYDVIVIAGAAILGLQGPNLWIRLKTSRRNDALNKALPNALDLLVVCVEAGLGLDIALKRVGEEIAPTAPELSKELSLVSLEINTGIPRQKALSNLGERNKLEELRSLTAILVQADKFGTSIAHALRVSADSIRTKRRQAAEEKAAKTTVKLSFPLVLFILPSTFIIVIGPGIIRLIETVIPALTR
jgi:tight adherence protein C